MGGIEDVAAPQSVPLQITELEKFAMAADTANGSNNTGPQKTWILNAFAMSSPGHANTG